MTKGQMLIFIILLIPNTAFSKDDINFSHINEKTIQQILSSGTQKNEETINKISALFLGTPYESGRLIGSETEPEKLIIDFSTLDCFTYLDYVHALRQSKNIHSFFYKLIYTRYFSGEIDYHKRKHFFSDWISGETPNAKDITQQLSAETHAVTKHLNIKEDGGVYLPGIAPRRRVIHYIPGNKVDTAIVSKLKTGDYVGIYSNLRGLDVSHTGIFLHTKNGPVFRNASSLKTNMKVVDTPFLSYVRTKPGIVVYRTH